jgi:hypothetical protein
MARREVLEREIKKRISAYLDSLSSASVPVYYRMHVPFGYGKKSIDYEGCICGRFFGIEAKSPDNAAGLTVQQRDTCLDILAGGGKVFIISDHVGLSAFMRWVERCCRT